MRPFIGLPRLVALGSLVVAIAGCAALPRASRAPAPESAGGLAQVQRHLTEREYWASENASGLQAPNRAHRLRTYFEPDGIRVVDREDPESPELLGLASPPGAATARSRAPAKATLDHANERVEIRRPGLVEWFVNWAAGARARIHARDAPGRRRRARVRARHRGGARPPVG